MIWLWIAAALVSAGLAALVVQRAAAAARRTGDANPAMAVYQRQMAELDELAERGLIAESERRSVRAETGRRLLAAAARGETPLKASRPTTVLAVAAAVPLLAALAYVLLGAPGFPDQPFAQRLKTWESAASSGQPLDPPETAAVWRDLAARNPTDPFPLARQAEAELQSGQPGEAVQALHRAITLAPRRADLWEALGAVYLMQANGDVSPDAMDAFRHALAIDPTSPNARYYVARARIAAGDVAGGLADWRGLLAALPASDPRHDVLAQDIQTVATTGALPNPAAAPATGPSPQQAPGVGPAQIQGMVDGLAAKLKANPDDPAGWVQLVRALTVLGETDRRDAALAEARQRYAGHADILAALDAASKPPS
ncbi:MAG TPA: c-type cytochrome biogenesis protein CcmI [Caulobacteraceae bacterium]|jgi:cytochrome c-type biogenesis protein CcmH|nr:c-type cytochrome biogenesis protein CcmI [Caulobacteraceae bacterium]